MTRWLVGLTLTVVVAAALWAFEPWRLFTSSEIDEPVPTAGSADPASESPAAASPSASPSAAPSTSTSPSPSPRDRVLATGAFVPAEHATSGRVRLLRLADGRRFVRLEGLATSDGPDLHVWLSDQPSGGEWGSYDDGRHVPLGALKATSGNQNYAVPDDVDLGGLTSVVIWCDRFNVAFGTAPLALG